MAAVKDKRHTRRPSSPITPVVAAAAGAVVGTGGGILMTRAGLSGNTSAIIVGALGTGMVIWGRGNLRMAGVGMVAAGAGQVGARMLVKALDKGNDAPAAPANASDARDVTDEARRVSEAARTGAPAPPQRQAA